MTNFLKLVSTALPYILFFLGVLVFLGAIFLAGQRDARRAATLKVLEAEKAALVTKVQGQARERQDLIKRLEATGNLDKARVESSDRIRTVTKEIIREVPSILPAATAGAVLLPVGFGLLHDAAALGTPALLRPPAASGPDEAPVTAAHLATTVTENYGVCRDTSDRLEKLQDWACTVSPTAADYCSSDSSSSFSSSGGDL